MDEKKYSLNDIEKLMRKFVDNKQTAIFKRLDRLCEKRDATDDPDKRERVDSLIDYHWDEYRKYNDAWHFIGDAVTAILFDEI